MSRPYVFNTPIRLWHRIEGWRVFDQGSTDPGGAWFEEENGDTKPKGVNPDVAKALTEALAENEALTRRLSITEASLADAVGRADTAMERAQTAEGKLAELERDLKVAEAVAVELTGERDRARAQVAKADRKATAAPAAA